MRRLLFDAIELESFWCSNMQSCQKLSSKALCILVHFATTHLCESRFSSLLHFENKYRNHMNSLIDLRVALSNCVAKHERIISEMQQRKVMCVFLKNSDVWKLTVKVSVFCCFVSRPGLRITSSNLKHEETANRTFCNFYAFFKRVGSSVALFLWKGFQFQKRLGTYALSRNWNPLHLQQNV